MRRVLLTVAAALVAASCSGGGRTQATLPTVPIGAPAAGATTATPDEPTPEALVEPVEKNEMRRELLKAMQIYGFCQGWSILEHVPEPLPHDVDRLILFGTTVFQHHQHFDLTRKVPTRLPPKGNQPAKIVMTEVPDSVGEDLAVLRAAMYAFLVRVQMHANFLRQRLISQADLERRLDLAFVLLAADDITAAQQRLAAFDAEHCHLG